MKTLPLRMDGQGPTVQHRDPYPISWDKPKWKRILKKNMHVYVSVCIAESHCCMKLTHCKSTILQLKK